MISKSTGSRDSLLESGMEDSGTVRTRNKVSSSHSCDSAYSSDWRKISSQSDSSDSYSRTLDRTTLRSDWRPTTLSSNHNQSASFDWLQQNLQSHDWSRERTLSTECERLDKKDLLKSNYQRTNEVKNVGQKHNNFGSREAFNSLGGRDGLDSFGSSGGWEESSRKRFELLSTDSVEKLNLPPPLKATIYSPSRNSSLKKNKFLYWWNVLVIIGLTGEITRGMGAMHSF